MGVMQRVVKPKTRRGKRALINREPKLIENTKQGIFLRGKKCSDTCLKFIKDLVKLKKPHSSFLSRKNEYRPFEDAHDVENICKKYDTSLFGFGSHTKKRPHNVVLGRTYDQQILDMVEFGIENFKGLEDFKNAKVGLGCKPCLLFSGEPFLSPGSDMYRIKNLLIDFFHGEEIVNIRLEGIEHAISFTAVDNKIYMRSYRIILKKSGEKTPYAELEEIGPSAELVLRRSKLASADLFKSACKKPKETKVKKVKNISKDAFGSELGRVHIPKQNLNKLPTRNMKGLKKTLVERKLERAEKAKKDGTPVGSLRRTRKPPGLSRSATGANTTPLAATPRTRSATASGPSTPLMLHLSST